MSIHQNHNQSQMMFSPASTNIDELKSLAEILNSFDIHHNYAENISPVQDAGVHLVCWNKPAEEIEQALKQISSRYQDAIEIKK